MKVEFKFLDTNKFGSITEAKTVHVLWNAANTIEDCIADGFEAAAQDGIETIYIYSGCYWDLSSKAEDFIKENYSNVILTGGYRDITCWIDCFPTKIGSLTFRKLRAQYENKNCSFNVETKEAHSYNWWLFTAVRKGKLIFNNYGYSSSTTKHQSQVRRVMSTLNIKTHLIISTHADLKQLDHCAYQIEVNIAALITTIMKPGTRATSNQKRLGQIETLKGQVVELKKLMDDTEKLAYKECRVDYKADLKKAKAKVAEAIAAVQARISKPKRPKASKALSPATKEITLIQDRVKIMQQLHSPVKAKFTGLKLL